VEAGQEELSPEEWGQRYAPFIPHYAACAAKLADLLAELVAYSNISTEAVEGREKELESFVQKLRDGSHQYEDPLSEMPDLVGLRVVTYFISDAAVVRQIIEQNFDIDWNRSSVGGTDADPDRFGYSSDHYQVQLLPDRAGLPEWEPYAGIWVEIQVRTVLQHAWAAISHKLQYKAEREVPRALRRQLSRMSALLEVADKEFAELNQATAELDAQYVASIGAGDFDVELNADSLSAFLNVTERHLAYQREAEALGYLSFDGETLPEDVDQGLATLIRLALEGADLTARDDLAYFNELLPDPMPEHIRDGMKEIFASSVEKGFTPMADPIDMMVLAYCIALRGGLDPESTAENTPYRPALKAALRIALSNWDDES
jgi:putative GTP pyrophosphokinase